MPDFKLPYFRLQLRIFITSQISRLIASAIALVYYAKASSTEREGGRLTLLRSEK
jgi:hypothetical protein